METTAHHLCTETFAEQVYSGYFKIPVEWNSFSFANSPAYSALPFNKAWHSPNPSYPQTDRTGNGCRAAPALLRDGTEQKRMAYP